MKNRLGFLHNVRWQLAALFLAGLVVGIYFLVRQGGVEELSAAPSPAKQAYSEALIGSPERLNPLLDSSNPVDRDVDRLLYSGLLRFDSTGIPQPDLAQSWGVSQDGTIYNFRLRSDAKWHDGQPVTSADVVFTVGLMSNGGDIVPKDLQTLWKAVQVKALSTTDLQFILPEAYAPFADYLTFGVLPSHLLKGTSIDHLVDASFNLHPVGSGPFAFDHFITENGRISGLVLKAFDGYAGQSPKLREISFFYYTDEKAAMQAYRDGNVTGISDISPDLLSEALNEPGLALYSARLPSTCLIFFNLKSTDAPFLQDVAVRKALYQGLNRQKMIDTILRGQAISVDGPVLPGTWAYLAGSSPVEYDPAAAQKALDSAGYVSDPQQGNLRAKDGQALHFTLSYPDDAEHKALAQAIQSDWKALGVQVDLEPLPYDQLINQRLATHNYQAALADIDLSRSPDPDPYPFWDQFQIDSGQNYAQWDDKVASEYLEQARITVDLTQRTRLYHNFQVIFAQQLPALPLFNPVYTFAVDRHIQGIRLGPLFDSSDRFNGIDSWTYVAQIPTQLPLLITATPRPTTP